MKIFWDTRTFIIKWITLLILIENVTSQACSSSENLDYIVIDVDPQSVNQEIYRLPVEHTISVKKNTESVSGTNTNYIDVTYDDDSGMLIFSTKKEFEDFEDKEVGYEISIQATLTCATGTKTSAIMITINEVNNYPPEFQEQNYEIEIPVPLPKDLEITIFANAIIAKDKDVRNNNITFSLNDNELFYVKSVFISDKTYQAKIYAKKYLVHVEENFVLKLTATDNGKPDVKENTVDVFINTNGNSSFQEKPTFEKPLYIDALNDNLELNSPIKVILEKQTFVEGMDFELDEHDSGLFTIKSKETNEVEIILSRKLTPDDIIDKNNLKFIVIASLIDGTKGSTVVLVNFQKYDKLLEFNQPIYTGIIDTDLKLDLEPIVLKADQYNEQIDYEMDGQDIVLFEYTSEKNIITIKLAKELEENDVKDKITFQFVLYARINKVRRGSTTVTLTIVPKKILEFKNSINIGVIKPDLSLEIDDIDLLDLTLENVLYDLEDGDKSLFKIASADGNRVKIVLEKPLSGEDVKDRITFQFTLKATHPNSLDGKTNVLIKIDHGSIIAFEQPVYIGKLNKKLELEDIVIALSEKSYSNKIKFNLKEGDSKLFKHIPGSIDREIVVTLEKPLSFNDIKNKIVFQFIVEASEEGKETGTVAVIVEIERDALTENLVDFGKSIYTGTVKSDLDFVMGPIDWDGSVDINEVDFILSEGDSALFDFDKTLNKKEITIKLKIPLTEGDIEGRSVFKFLITAIVNGKTDGTTNIVVAIDRGGGQPDKILAFEKPLYNGILNEDRVLNLENIVLTTDSYTEKVTFELTEGNYQLFTFEQDEQFKNILKIKLKKPLTESDIQGKVFLQFAVIAKEPEKEDGLTVIVIEIEKDERPGDNVEFGKTLYTGKIDSTFKINLNPIDWLGSVTADGVEFELSEDDFGLFDIEKSSTKKEIKIIPKKPLVEEDIIDKLALKFLITAVVQGKRTSRTNIILAIEREPEQTEKNLVFEKSLYNGKVNKFKDLELELIVLAEKSYSDKVKFELTEGDFELFEFKKEDRRLTIKFKNELTDSDINDKVVLQFAVKAFETGKEDGTTIVILEIEKETTTEESIDFGNSLYVGTINYEKELVIKKIKWYSNVEADNINFELSEGDSALFKVNVIESEKALVVTLKKELTDDDIKNRLTMTFSVIAILRGNKVNEVGIVLEIQQSPVLVFEQPVYVGKLDKKRELDLGTIVLAQNSYPDKINFDLEGGDYLLFKTEKGNSDRECVIKLKNPLTSNDIKNKITLQFVVFANLEGKKENGKTAVVIEIERDSTPENLVEFDKSLYTGTIKDLNLSLESLKWEGGVEPDEVDFRLSEDDYNLFEITKSDTDQHLITINPKKPLTDEDIKNKAALKFLVTAFVKEKPNGKTNVILGIDHGVEPSETALVFEKSMYNGKLNKALQLELESVILFKESYSDKVAFDLKEGDSQLFNFTKSENELSIVLKKALTESDIHGRTMLHLNVVATEEGKDDGLTIVVIEIERDDTTDDYIKFGKTLYTGSISNLIVQLNPIDWIGTVPKDQIKFQLSEDDFNLFTYKEIPNKNEIEILPKVPLTEEDIKNHIVLKFLVTAVVQEKPISKTNIILGIDHGSEPSDSVLAFEKSIYNGKLNKFMNLELETVILAVESFSDKVTFELKEDDYNLFTLEQIDKSNKLKITLKEPLKESDIEDKVMFQFAAVASEADKADGITVIVIEIERESTGEEYLELDKSLYLGNINSEFAMKLDKMKWISSVSQEQIAFKLAEGDSSLFKIEKVGSEKAVEVSLLKPLTNDQVKDRITFTFLVVGYIRSTPHVEVTVVLEINHGMLLNFEKLLYIGKLDKNLELKLEPINLIETSYSDKVTFSLKGDDSKFFKIESGSTDRQKLIKLKNPLNNNDIKDRIIFQFNALAQEVGKENGVTAIVIEIYRESISDKLVEFEKTLYTGIIEDLSLNLNPILWKGSADPENVDFKLSEDDFQLFNLVISTTKKEITITTKKPLGDDDIKDKLTLKFLITSFIEGKQISKSNIVLAIQRNGEPSDAVLVFEKPMYNGYVDKFKNLELEKIILSEESYSENVVFELKEGEHEFFKFEQHLNKIIIALKNPLTEIDIQDKVVLQFAVFAKENGQKEGVTVVVIAIDKEPIPDDGIEFEKSIYFGKINSETDIELEHIQFLSNLNADQIDFQLADGDYELFNYEILKNKNAISIELKKPLTEDNIMGKITLSFLIIGKIKGDISGRTSVVLEIDYCSSIPASSLVFQQPIYKGKLTESLDLEIDTITLLPQFYTETVKFTLKGDEVEWFELKSTDNNIQIQLHRFLNNSDIEDKIYIQLLVLAEDEDLSGYCVVIIEISALQCVFPDKDLTPKFDKDSYEKLIGYEQLGKIMYVKATVTNKDIEIKYQLDIDDPALEPKIVIDFNGAIILNAKLDPNTYEFNVIATNTNDNLSGKATVLLTVDTIADCIYEEQVINALIVKRLEENSEHMIQLEFNNPDGCNYKITDVEPKQLKQFFSIEEKFLKTEKFDREHEIFRKQLHPQFKITLEMTCNENINLFSLTSRSNFSINSRAITKSDENYVKISDILLQNDHTILSIIIQDENDNYPVFEHPSGNILLGYPEPVLAEKILPPYLIQVYASDLDEGENAEIKYTLDDTTYFNVHPKSGIIYPLSKKLPTDKSVKIIVKAIDQNGAGNVNTTEIEVRQLESKYFAVLSLKNENSENIDEIIKSLVSETEFNIKVLSSAMISSQNDEENLQKRIPSNWTKSNENTVLRMIVYAFDAEMSPVDSSEIIEKLNQGGTEDREVISMDDVISGNNYSEKTDTTGLIAGISVLSVVVVLLIAGIIALWWFCIRGSGIRCVETRENSISSEAQLEDEHQTSDYPIPAEVVKQNEIYRENVHYSNENEVPTQSRDGFLARSLTEMLEADDNDDDKDNSSINSERERNKSVVTFNEMVEQYEIPVTDGKKVDPYQC